MQISTTSQFRDLLVTNMIIINYGANLIVGTTRSEGEQRSYAFTVNSMWR